MKRQLLCGATTAVALLGILSCSENNVTGVDDLDSDELAADASRIATIGVTLASASIRVGDTTRATARLADYQNRQLSRTVAWSSSNPAVASVGTSGLVTGLAEGTSQIIASRGTKSDSATIKVTRTVIIGSAAAVASVSVALASSSLSPGQSTQATATTYDSSNNILAGRAITWSSSDTMVARVSPTGLVSAVAAGTSQVIATSEGKQGSAPFSVTAAQQISKPGTVTDLKVVGTDSTGVTLSFTQVDDGNAHPAEYDVRYAPTPIGWGSATSTMSGTCAVPVVGTAIGIQLVCKVVGLKPSTQYDFQLVAFRGTLNFNAVFGPLSNIVSAKTSAVAPPPTVAAASVTVSPATASISAGATVQLSATTRDANNNVLTGRVISWTSSNTGVATVSSSGLVLAVATGQAQITAMSENKSGNATLTIAAPPPPPPPPPPGGSVEPSGMTRITENAFSAANEDGWYYEYNQTNALIVQDATAPRSPSAIMQFRFPAGMSGGVGPNSLERDWSENTYKTLYVSSWMKVSSNFYGHCGPEITKTLHIWVGDGSVSGNKVYSNIRGCGTDPLSAWMNLQGVVAGGNFDGGSSAEFRPNLGQPASIIRGQWHKYELVLVGNTSGNRDGTLDWWLDGVHVGSYTGIQYVPGAAYWQLMKWNPTWGGLGGTVPADMYESMDHIYISGKR